jgi:4-amino-4-deoxy-L-arabinose transferase-like glycosyltransferase
MALVADPPVLESTVQRRLSSPSWLATVTEHRWVCWLCLFAYCAWLFFYGITTGEFYRTESLRAIIAAEFLRSGNWIVPTLYGEPLFTKPPGMYAAIALASWPTGGVCEWTARLPSAVAGTCIVFLFYWYFSRQLGRQAGLVAALILPMSLLCLDKSMAAEIDMLQAFWVSASILFFLRGLELVEGGMEDGEWRTEDRGVKIEYRRIGITSPSVERPSSIIFQNSAGAKSNQTHDSPSSILHLPSSPWFWWLAALLCVAGGVLTKWTGAAFFYGAVVPLLWWRGQLRLLCCRHHLIPAAIAAAICLTWVAAAIAMTSWPEFYETVSREALMRLSPSHHHRPYPWKETLGHPFRLLAAGLPCSAFALLTIRAGFTGLWDVRGRRLLQALHCWVWPNMLFWTVIPEHATRHSFPLFPGLAGLAAMVWIAWLRGDQMPSLSRLWIPSFQRRPLPSLQNTSASIPITRVFLGMILLWLVVKLAFVEAVLPRRNPKRQPREKGEQLAALVPANDVLYLFQLKDEGIMFYYGRTVRRLTGPAQLPSSDQALYCILDQTEWTNWADARPVETLLKMPDEQGDPIFLVRVDPPGR